MAALAISVAAPGCTFFGDNSSAVPEPWIAPLFEDHDLRFDELCEIGACVSDLVALPSRRFVTSTTDLQMPEPLGALSVERLWTGERRGIFGEGWETIWDVRLTDGQLTGPVPARPVEQPARGTPVRLIDGSLLEFDDTGRPTTVCSADAICTHATWPTEDVQQLRLIAEAADDRHITLEFEDGRVISSSTHDGRTARFRYEGSRLAGVLGESPTEYRYDELGRLVGIDGPGDRRTIEYEGGTSAVRAIADRDGRFTEISEPAEGVQSVSTSEEPMRMYRFDDARLVEISDDTAGLLLWRRYVDGVLASEERPVDGVTLERNATGEIRVVEEIDDAAPRAVLYRVDDRGRVMSVESAAGLQTYSYDDDPARPAAISNAHGGTRYRYDDRGLLVETTDADGYRVTIDRDASGLPTQVSDGLTWTRFTYDSAGRVATEISGEQTATASYSSSGDLTAIVGTDGQQVSYGLNERGRLTTVEGRERTQLSYGPSGTLDDASAQQLDLVAPGNEAIPADPSVPEASRVLNDDGTWTLALDPGSSATFDMWGRATEVERNGAVTQREYDEAGNLVRLVEPGREFTLEYTPAGRVSSVETDEGTVRFEWHGDLLTAIETNDGTRTDYKYAPSGDLISVMSGSLRWNYTYDSVGNVTSVAGPTGSQQFGWDEEGRPVASVLPSGAIRTFEWDADALIRLTEPSGETVELERDDQGRITTLATDEGTTNFDYDNDGRLTTYLLADGTEGDVTYGSDGVQRIEFDGHVEQWDIDGGEIRRVVVGDDDPTVYELEWIGPGLLGSVNVSGDPVIRTEIDDRQRITRIGADDETVAEFSWDWFGLSAGTVDDDAFTIARDMVGRVDRIEIGDIDYRAEFVDGAIRSISADELTQEFQYVEGRLASSVASIEGDRVELDWDVDGSRVAAFTTPDGTGEFRYDDGVISAISFNGDTREVDLSGSSPSASGFAGDLLSDLFDERGYFRGADTRLDAGPDIPILRELPSELGLVPPSVLTPDAIIEAAVDSAIPEVPLPLMIGGEQEIARRLADLVMSMGATLDVPIAPSQTVRLTVSTLDRDAASLLATSPTLRAGDSLLDRFAPSPCILCRVVDFGSSVISGVGSAAVSVYRFVIDNPVTRAALTAAFVVASFIGFSVALSFCPTLACRAALVTGTIVASELVLGSPTSLGELLYAAAVQPVIALVRGAIALDAAAVLTSTVLLASLVTPRGVFRSPAITRRINAAACSSTRVVCISAARHGPAAAHIREAQRLGYGRVYTIDRKGTDARRANNLRGIDRRAGWDRDEVPPAYMIGRLPTAHVRHIEPWANRGAGAVLGAQTRGLRDGTRVWVRAI